MRTLLTIIAIAAVLVLVVPEAEAREIYNRRGSRAHIGSFGTGGGEIYSSSPAIRYRHNLGRKYRYHHERPYPYYRSTPRYFTGAPYYRSRGFYRYGSYGRYSGCYNGPYRKCYTYESDRHYRGYR